MEDDKDLKRIRTLAQLVERIKELGDKQYSKEHIVIFIESIEKSIQRPDATSGAFAPLISQLPNELSTGFLAGQFDEKFVLGIIERVERIDAEHKQQIDDCLKSVGMDPEKDRWWDPKT